MYFFQKMISILFLLFFIKVNLINKLVYQLIVTYLLKKSIFHHHLNFR